MRALPPRRIAFGALCAAVLATTTGPAALAADSAPERDRTVSAAALRAQVQDADAHRSGLSPVVDLVKAVLDTDGGRLPPGRAAVLADAARAAVAGAADDDPPTSITMTTVTTATSSSTTQAATPAATPAVTDPAAGLLVPAAGTTGLADDALGAVREALDGVLDLLLPKDATTATGQDSATTTGQDSATTTGQDSATTTGQDSTAATDEESTAAADEESGTAAGQEPAAADDLLDRVDELLDALLGADPEASAEESTGTSTGVTTLPAPAEAVPAAPAGTGPAVLPSLTSLLLPNS
ncbi:hypothetical protein ABZ690_35035 [Streptomyces sp. NPDC006967]|uniref:hypothetical protein n=1 Tax=Streptomyces sp. NPDC006967 TaxID=3156906 RepID=UPI0033FEBC16